MVAPMSPLPCVMMSMKALRSRLSATARRRFGLSNGGLSRLRIRLRATFVAVSTQIACGACSLNVKRASDERQVSRGNIFDNVPLDAVEIGPVGFPVIRVSRRSNHLVRQRGQTEAPSDIYPRPCSPAIP
jgi:hypothetical protein